ncbi:hypothetical protein Tco_0082285, partial [Tanacetum coccineum]
MYVHLEASELPWVDLKPQHHPLHPSPPLPPLPSSLYLPLLVPTSLPLPSPPLPPLPASLFIPPPVLMHTTMVPEQVKTMKIQARIQVSRQGELRRQLQLWKRFGRLYLIVCVLVRNI